MIRGLKKKNPTNAFGKIKQDLLPSCAIEICGNTLIIILTGVALGNFKSVRMFTSQNS